MKILAKKKTMRLFKRKLLLMKITPVSEHNAQT